MYSQEQLELLLGPADKEFIEESIFLDFDLDSIPELIATLYTGSALDLLGVILKKTPSESLDLVEYLIEEIIQQNEENESTE